MMRSLYSAVSGLRNHQTRMDVLGNNIANVNTIAFKSSAVRFQDVLYQKLSSASGATDNLGGVNAKNIGLGMGVAATTMAITTQGAAQTGVHGMGVNAPRAAAVAAATAGLAILEHMPKVGG